LEDREYQFSQSFQDAKTALEDQAIKLQKATEIDFKKQLKALEKKLDKAQRDLRNKTQLLRQQNKLNSSGRNQTLNTSLRSSKGITMDDPMAKAKKNNDKLKARIINLEKSYEIMKTKSTSLQDQLEKERTERNKFQDNYYKVKAKKDSIDKDNKSLLAKITDLELQLGHAVNQISILENNTTRFNNIITKEDTIQNELKVNDLEDTQNLDNFLQDDIDKEIEVPISQLIKQSHQKKTPKKSKPKENKGKIVEYIYPKNTIEENNLFMELNWILIGTLDITIPVLMEEFSGKSNLVDTSFISITPQWKLEYSFDEETEGQIDESKEGQNQQKSLNFGEILYPAFNNLAPKLLESIFVCKNVSDNYKNIQSFMYLTWSCLSFAFNSQILSSTIKDVVEKHKYGHLADDEVNMFEKSFDTSDNRVERKFMPLQLNFKAKTGLFKKKIKEIHHKSKMSDFMKKSRVDGIQLPIYAIFKDDAISEVLVNDLIELLFPSKIINDNKENSQLGVNENSQNKLKSSSKLKKSIHKPVLREENPKPMVERKDQMSLKLKILCCCMINILSTSTKPISQILKFIGENLPARGEEFFEETCDLLFEFNAIPYIVLNLLSEKLVTSSLNILTVLVIECEDKDRILEKLLEISLFEIMKIVTVKYSKNKNIFQELVIILQRLTQHDPIKVKEFWSPDYVEFLNKELEKQSKIKKNEDDEMNINNLSQIIKCISL